MPALPAAAPAVKALVFDAYGTIFDVASAVMRHAGAIGPDAPAFAAHWRAKQLEYTWTYTLMGAWRDFWQVTGEALDHAFERFPAADRSVQAALMDAYRTLTAYPEVPSALDRLRAAGYRTAILSNGETTMLADAVAAAGLAARLDGVWSVDEVAVFKPDPRVYELARSKLELAPHETALVSSNRWDVAGAVAFGFVGLWVNRTGQPGEYTGLPPVATVASFDELG